VKRLKTEGEIIMNCTKDLKEAFTELAIKISYVLVMGLAGLCAYGLIKLSRLLWG